MRQPQPQGTGSPHPGTVAARRRWRWRMRLLVALGGLGLLAPLATRAWPFSMGRAWWALDLASHWQGLFAGCLGFGLALALALERRWLLGALLLPLPLWTASPALPPADPNDTAAFLLASANVHVSTLHVDRLANWLADASPDAVVLLEVSPALARELPGLKNYPHQAVHPDDSPFGIAVLSKHPLVSSRTVLDADGIPRIEAEIAWDAPGQAQRRLKLAAFHPMPPLTPHFHATRDAALRDIARQGQAQGLPSLLAGDLNATPWSSAFSGLEALGWRRATGLRPTWPAWGGGVFGIPIDHVLASGHWRVQAGSVGPDIGSDHRPILVRLALRGGEPATPSPR